MLLPLCFGGERLKSRCLSVEWLEERAFTVEEALAAKEAFITSASVFVQGVVAIDGKQVGNGKVGPITDRLREIYVEFAKATAV